MDIDYLNDEEVKISLSNHDIDMIKRAINILIDELNQVSADILHICKRVYDVKNNGWSSNEFIIMPRITYDAIEKLIELGISREQKF